MVDQNVLNYFERTKGTNNDNALVLNGTVNSNKVPLSVVNVVTLAEINAGKTILAGVTGKTITVLDFAAKVNGTFITTTTVDLEDTNGTPVVISALAVANLTDGNVIKPGDTGSAEGAGYLGALTLGAGLAVTNTGSAAAGGTDITFLVEYLIQ